MTRTSRSIRRRTSASVRTVVVLPVPPFSDRTEIVAAMRAATLQALLGQRRGLGRRARRTADGRGVHEPQRVTADRDLVAVLERAPLDPPAVDEDAVERAVVEHARAVGLVDDERVAPGDRRVVEAHVGGQRAADPRPLALHRNDLVAGAVREDEVLARDRQALARLGDERGRLLAGRRGGRRRGNPLALQGERPGTGKLARRTWVHQVLLWARPDGRAILAAPLRSGS